MPDQTLPDRLRVAASLVESGPDLPLTRSDGAWVQNDLREAADRIEELEQLVPDPAVIADAIEAEFREAYPVSTGASPSKLRETAERAAARAVSDGREVAASVRETRDAADDSDPARIPYRFCIVTGGTCSQTRCMDHGMCWEAATRNWPGQPEHPPVDVLAIMRGLVNEAVDEKAEQLRRRDVDAAMEALGELAEVDDTGPRVRWPRPKLTADALANVAPTTAYAIREAARLTPIKQRVVLDELEALTRPPAVSGEVPFEVFVRINPSGVADASVYRHGLLVEVQHVSTVGDCIALGHTLTSRLVNAMTAGSENGEFVRVAGPPDA